MIGTSITGVVWTPDITPGYARYFITLSIGGTRELRQSGIQEAELPDHATSMASEFGSILRGPGIAGVYVHPDGSKLAVVLLSRQYLLLFGTFDGESAGNNFTLQSPPFEEDWLGEMQRDWRRLA